MKYLTFTIDSNIYGIVVNKIIEILPLTALEMCNYEKEWFEGLLHYNEQFIPVIDLKKFMFQKDSINRMNTRIVILQRNESLFGMIIERVNRIESINDNSESTRLNIHLTKGISEVKTHNGHSIRLLNFDEIIPESLFEIQVNE